MSKLTSTQILIMRNIRDHNGDPTARGFYGLSQHGGAGGSRLSLERRGLVKSVPMSPRYELTEAGQQALADVEAKPQKENR